MFYSTSSWPFTLALFPSLYLFSLSFCVYYQSHFFQFVFLSLLFSVLSVFVTLPSFFRPLLFLSITLSFSLTLSLTLSFFLSLLMSLLSLYISLTFFNQFLYLFCLFLSTYSPFPSLLSLLLYLCFVSFSILSLCLSSLSLSLSPFSHIN
jgi:hypothetical protein